MDKLFAPFPASVCSGGRLTTKQLSDTLNVPIDEIARWVRAGAPYERTGNVRSPRVFDLAQFVRWKILREIYQKHGERAAEHARMRMERELYRLKLSEAGVRVPDPDDEL